MAKGYTASTGTKGYSAKTTGGPTVRSADATPSTRSTGQFMRSSARGLGRSHQRGRGR